MSMPRARQRAWMVGKCSFRKASPRWVASSHTWSRPCFFISKSMARATMSRGASSPRESCACMKRVPPGSRPQARQREQCALAAHGLGDQEAAFLRVVQARRVELDELHVADAAAGAPRHRDAVTGGGIGVRGVAVDLAGSAGGQHHGRRRQRVDAAAVDVQRVDAVATRGLGALEMARRDEVDRHPALAQRDVRMAPCLGQQHLVDRAAGGIGRVCNAAHGVTSFTGQVQPERAARVGRERDALVHQPLHGRSTLLGDEARGVLVDQAGAGVLRVANVRVDTVVAAQHADDAALRPCGGGLRQVAFGQHHHRATPGQLERHRQAGQPGTDHDHCSIRSRHPCLPSIRNVADSARGQRHRCHAPTEGDGRPIPPRGAL